MSAREHLPPPDIRATFPDLAGKTAVVTGASRGIGVGIATFLGRQGMRLVLCGRTESAGKEVVAGLASDGVECMWVTADLATPAGAQRVFEEGAAGFDEIDVLVNNAARLHSRPILQLSEAEYHETFERNGRMIYGITILVARHMAERGSGCIISISSVGGLRAHRGMSAYDASKGAVDALTRSMALDLAPHGIRVNAVAPGLTPKGERPARHEGIPLGRTAVPLDIGAAVGFLASTAASYITGQVLYVDGGLTAQLTPPGIFILGPGVVAG